MKRGLPERIVDRLAEMMGGEPTEDDALIAAIKEIGRSHEKRQEEKKRLQDGNSVGGSGKNSKKRKRGSEKGAATQENSSAPNPKKQQTGNSSVNQGRIVYRMGRGRYRELIHNRR